MDYNEYKKSSRIAVDTAEIDEKNFNAVSDISEIATQQLRNFDQTYSVKESPAESYKKFRDEVVGMTQSQTESELEIDLGMDEFIPAINEKKQEIVEEEKTVAFKLNFKGKLLISVCAYILLMMSILLIYNAVLINSYNTQINAGYETLSEIQNINGTLEEELFTMENSFEYSAEALGLNNGSSTAISNTFEKQEKIVYAEETNWFDAICDFISSIFGG